MRVARVDQRRAVSGVAWLGLLHLLVVVGAQGLGPLEPTAGQTLQLGRAAVVAAEQAIATVFGPWSLFVSCFRSKVEG